MSKATCNESRKRDILPAMRAPRTVPPRVAFGGRSVTDGFWAFLYIVTYILFIGCGFYLVSQNVPFFHLNDKEEKSIHEFYREDVEQCCANGDGPVCEYLRGKDNRRRLQAGDSKFVGNEGIFEAFAEAPEVVLGLTGIAFGLTLLWLLMLKFCAKPIIILIEVAKIAILVFLTITVGNTSVSVFAVFGTLALGLIIYDYIIDDKLMFAAKIISYSTVALKENPSILGGSFLLMLFYVGNAALFVLFFIFSIGVGEVRDVNEMNPDMATVTCDFVPYRYTFEMYSVISFGYLWTLLLIDKIRLSLIANIVGSWHFHPADDRAGVCTTFSNLPKSLGTLSISALISTIAEKINRTMNRNCCWSCCGCTWFGPAIFITFPLHCINCITCNIFKTLLMMLTKYSVILHIFTGQAFLPSAKNVFHILSRHFVGGFVTETTSKTLLSLGT